MVSTDHSDVARVGISEFSKTASAMKPRTPRLVRSDDCPIALNRVCINAPFALKGMGAVALRFKHSARYSSAEHSAMSFLIAAADSCIRWSACRPSVGFDAVLRL